MRKWANILIACTISSVLPELRPGALWSMQGETYEGIVWLDQTQTKPTQLQIVNARAACVAAELERAQRKAEARLTLKSSKGTAAQKIAALTLLLDFDK